MAPSLEEQQKLKVKAFGEKTPIKKLQVHSLGEGFLRTRLDLTWQNDHWGFWNSEKSQVTAIEVCQQVTAPLQQFFQDFRKIHWPVSKASARLRVSPDGVHGVWLDFANEDIKELFSEVKTLQALSEIAKIEVGQRRKSLHWDGSRWRLKDPLYEPWTSTFVQGEEQKLWSLIGGFSQTGPSAQRVISKILEELLIKVNCRSLLEFGAGFGALTLPAAAQGSRKIYALEFEQRSVLGLEKTLQDYEIASVEILCGDYQKKAPPEVVVDTYLVNPPRSGIGNLFASIPSGVKNLIYMSCYPESFFKDTELLRSQGFRGIEAHLIDQFPQTPHSEWMSLWTRG